MPNENHTVIDLAPGFWSGVLVTVGALMFFQDWMGLDAWIAYEQAHWANLSPVVGACITVVGVIAAIRINP